MLTRTYRAVAAVNGDGHRVVVGVRVEGVGRPSRRWSRSSCRRSSPAPTGSGCGRPTPSTAGACRTTLPTLAVLAEVDLGPLREGAVRALPVGRRVGVGQVGRPRTSRCWSWPRPAGRRRCSCVPSMPVPLTARRWSGCCWRCWSRSACRCASRRRSGVNVTVTVQERADRDRGAVVGLAEVAGRPRRPRRVAALVPVLVIVTVCVAGRGADRGAGEGQAGRVGVEHRSGRDAGAGQA